MAKLTKSEWERTEIPVSAKELKVLRFLCEATKNVNLRQNDCLTLYHFLKIQPSPKMDKVLAEFMEKGTVPKNADKSTKIRLENSKDVPADLYEKRLLAALMDKDVVRGYYTAYHLLGLNVSRPNLNLQERAARFLEETVIDLRAVVLRLPELLASSDLYDLKLYEYQKEMFEIQPGLVILTAPTGTGKTLLPICMAEKGHRILYVCDRPTALDFAQKSVSIGRKVAFAFGCSGPEDVRLHHSAAIVFKKNKFTGGIGKVDNMVGDAVEIVIADIASAEHAIQWWAFQKKNYDLLYWDEPDKDKHTDKDQSLWAAAQRTWRANTAPFIVLSSATLPPEMPAVEEGYSAKFAGSPIFRVGKNTVYNGTQVLLLNAENEVVMPHHVFNDPAELKECADTIRRAPSLLRYVDLGQAVEVLKRSAGWEITSMADAVNPIFIKQAYLSVMSSGSKEMFKLYPSVIRATREDAWTVTGAAAIYMAHDVEKVGHVMLKAAGIPDGVLAQLKENIEINTRTALKREELKKEFENAVAVDAEKTNKMKDERYSNPAAKKIQEELKLLVRMPVKLDDKYVPNMPAHLAQWRPGCKSAFAPEIDSLTAEKIVDTKVADHWKLLLLIGVAVLTEIDDSYLEIVKQMASMGKLFMVIADFTYLTGTNYQFGHGYFGRDLADLNEGMVIQALGRIGRGDLQGCTARVREEGMFKKLFGPKQGEHRFLDKVFSYE